MRILAFGATGFIGSYVTRRLINQGHKVTVFHRGKTRADFLDEVDVILGDRNNLSGCQDALLRSRPDVIVDIVPYTKKQALSVCSLFRGKAKQVVAVSSSDVYRNYDGFRGEATIFPDPVPLTEDAPLRDSLYPYRGYGLEFEWADEYEKIEVEQVYLSEPDLPGTILRLPAVFGPGDKQHRIETYLRQMDDTRPAIILSERQAKWCWTRGYVKDIAAAIDLVVTDLQAAGNVYNIGYEETFNEHDWILQIGEAAGWAGQIVTIPAELLPQEMQQPFDWSYDLMIDSSKIRKELGYSETYALADALEETVSWERSNRDPSKDVDYSVEDEALKKMGF